MMTSRKQLFIVALVGICLACGDAKRSPKEKVEAGTLDTSALSFPGNNPFVIDLGVGKHHLRQAGYTDLPDYLLEMEKQLNDTTRVTFEFNGDTLVTRNQTIHDPPLGGFRAEDIDNFVKQYGALPLTALCFDQELGGDGYNFFVEGPQRQLFHCIVYQSQFRVKYYYSLFSGRQSAQSLK
jgi:hypothetical protein